MPFFCTEKNVTSELYDWVIKNRMKSNENLYSLDLRPHQKKVKSVFRIMFSQTLFPFYSFNFLATNNLNDNFKITTLWQSKDKYFTAFILQMM